MTLPAGETATPNFGLIKFIDNFIGWGEAMNINFDIIDANLGSSGVGSGGPYLLLNPPGGLGPSPAPLYKCLARGQGRRRSPVSSRALVWNPGSHDSSLSHVCRDVVSSKTRSPLLV